MQRKKSMLENAAILFIAMGITKVVGALLKIPLGNILGGLGMSYFSSAYSVFGPVYALTAAAIPTVLTKMVAQNAAAGKYGDVRKIKKVALRAAALLGFAGTVIILVITVPFARFVADAPKSIPSMLIIAPSVFFCCIAAVYRGYYEGLRNTLPTALSQVVEAVVKAALGVALSYIVLLKTDSLPYAAAAAVLGITVSEAVGLLFLFLRDSYGDGISKDELDFSPSPESGVNLLKIFFKEAFPITLGALAINLNSLIDLITITNSINLAISKNRMFFLAEFTYGLQGGIELADLGNFIYGSYTGIVTSLFTLIPAMTGMLGKSALPAVTAAWVASRHGQYPCSYKKKQKNSCSSDSATRGVFVASSHEQYPCSYKKKQKNSCSSDSATRGVFVASNHEQYPCSYENKQGNMECNAQTAAIARNLKILFKGTFMLGLPLCLGMAIFSEPILNLLYSSRPAEALVCARPLLILSLGGLTLSLAGTLFSVFYAIGRADLPIKIMLAGAFVKLGLNLCLIRIPELNISGAAIATVSSYTVICVLGFICLAKLIKIKIGIPAFFCKALCNSLLCCIAAIIGYHFIFVSLTDILRLGFSVAAGAGIYLIMTLFSDKKALKNHLFKRGKY
ncbi:MAG: polysaccharide biosynthesis C-terminal domain-containing protein [Oscillospiraceae bacterium]|nr:polysaccharide biosynthesis C-terminal domain-containing protein [Oscillospiraceae bacterium]